MELTQGVLPVAHAHDDWWNEMNENVLQHPPHLPLIAPSILASDFARLGEEAADVEKNGADLLHVDIMDGHFVPNLTMGPDIVMALAKASHLMQDVHLMVSNPDEFVDAFAQAGAKNMTFHIEVRRGDAAIDLIKRIHDLGCSAGICLNPATPVEDLADVMQHADMILVMSVVPGFTGQPFMPEVLNKVRFLRHELKPTQRLQIDGGIGIRTAHQALEAGADVLVAGAAIFRNPERAQTIKLLRGDYPKWRSAPVVKERYVVSELNSTLPNHVDFAGLHDDAEGFRVLLRVGDRRFQISFRRTFAYRNTDEGKRLWTLSSQKICAGIYVIENSELANWLQQESGYTADMNLTTYAIVTINDWIEVIGSWPEVVELPEVRISPDGTMD